MTAGSRTVLDELCDQRYGRLVALATMLTGSPDQARDLVHDAVVASFGRVRSFDSLNAADAYVRRAITTRYIDRSKKDANRRSAEASFSRRLPAADGIAVDYDPQLAEALGALAPRVRACVVLRFVEDMSTAQTAAALGISEGAVKRYVSDGVSMLNRVLGTAAAESGPEREPILKRGERP